MTRPAASPIVLSSYDPDWPRLFAEERQRLQAAIGEWAVVIEHVGSTSIPGIAAKPIIDIVVAVAELVDELKCITPLVEIGYDCKGEFGIPERVFFRKLTDTPLPGQVTNGIGRTHQVHMFQRDNIEVERHIAFRDYLRANPDARQAYEDLKRRLAAEHEDIEAYADAKSEFVESVLRKAGAPERVR